MLLEHTGHYHRLLEQYLLDLDITVYRIHVQKRPTGMMKTDKRDALRLAKTLYTQLALGAQVADKMQFVRPAAPPSRAAIQLRGLTRHRYELSQEANQQQNKLTAICDELFPEFTQVFRDPNAPSALLYRGQFPTPHAIATASIPALKALRLRKSFPSDAQLLRLQQLAKQTIGIKDVDRQRGLQFEQRQLIKELQLLREHLGQLEEEINGIVTASREGQILLSIPAIGPVQTATIIASIGTIAHFEKASELKSYFGWAPQNEQTGISTDHARLTKRGTRTMKQMLFLMAMRSVQGDNEWARIYRDLVPRMCSYDEKLKDYRGK